MCNCRISNPDFDRVSLHLRPLKSGINLLLLKDKHDKRAKLISIISGKLLKTGPREQLSTKTATSLIRLNLKKVTQMLIVGFSPYLKSTQTSNIKIIVHLDCHLSQGGDHHLLSFPLLTPLRPAFPPENGEGV